MNKGNMTGHINVSVANCYDKASYSGEIITQVLIGEKVDILDQSGDFLKIKQLDGYESWISKHQLTDGFDATGKKIVARSHILRIYNEKKTSSLPVKDAVIGCRFVVIDEDSSWYRVRLPGGRNRVGQERALRSLSGTFP